MRLVHFALASASLLAAPAAAGEELTIGDKAPAIAVSDWIKGEPVRGLREDHTYVVEFWATWCPPCRKSIPHLTELQKKYGKKITVIGVSVDEEHPAGVAPFVKKMGDAMNYTVAADLVSEEHPRGFMAKNWLEAAGQAGIPSVFIVRDGKINWIGSPFEMDGPLAQIVAGKWDLDLAIAKARLIAERNAKIRPLYEKYNKAKYFQRWQEAIAVIDQILAIDATLEVEYGGPKFEYLLRLSRYEDAYAYGAGFVTGPAWEHPAALNYVAWMIVDPDAALEKKDLALALKAATRADELTDNDEPAIIDTLAKVYFDMGKVERAIQLQTKAVKLAREKELYHIRDELEKRLEQYERAVSTEGV